MASKLIRKTSILIVFSIVFSMLVPIISYAAPLMDLYYKPASYYVYKTNISGYVYTKDPSSVSVTANNSDNSVTPVTHISSNCGGRFDDNNTTYYCLEYDFEDPQMTEAPTSISVVSDGTEYTLSGAPLYSDLGEYRYKSSLTDDTLGTYRMPGHFLTSVAQATYSLPAGSDILKFTPNHIDTDAHGEGIFLQLPYNNSDSTAFNDGAIEPSDFEIVDESVSSDVYFSGFEHFDNGRLYFDNLSPRLVNGHEYLIKLSPTSSGDEITLPPDGTYTAYVRIGDWVFFPVSENETNYFEDYNSVYFRNLVIGDPSASVPTDPPIDPPVTDDPPVATVPPTSTPAPVPSAPVTPSHPDQEIVNEASLKNGTKDKVAVEIAEGTKQVLLPANAADSIGDRTLELNNNQLSIEVPTGTLKKLESMVPADQLAGARISFTMNPLSGTDLDPVLSKASDRRNLKLKAAGGAYDFKLSVITADGTEKVLSQFDQPITLRFKVPSNANPDLLGIYYIDDNGNLEYVGGQVTDGEIVAQVRHFSTYAALEYDKTFDDVPEQYWASSLIKELTAKQIITGTSDNTFAPTQFMTRGEFATLIARALDLDATGQASFTDVASATVISEDIAAVNQAGIIQGRSATVFAPDDYITREEMAAMIIRAYEYKKGEKVQPATIHAYSDRKIASKWALPYIDTASEIGFVKGRGNEAFAPKQFMTRAEGAQEIYLLLKDN